MYSFYDRTTMGNGIGPVSLPLKYYKKLKVYKASNVVFNPETMTATSYGWWLFVRKIGKKIVFNNFSYSNSTRRHQNKVDQLLDQLGIKVDLRIEAPKGLQDLKSALAFYESLIEKQLAAIQAPRSHASKNLQRAQAIVEYKKQVREIRKLLKASQ